MAASNKWLRLDSAFALGFCSRCPSEEYLLELLIDSDFDLPGWARDAIFASISQINTQNFILETLKIEPDNPMPCPNWIPSKNQIGSLSTVCDRLFREHTDSDVWSLYRLGAEVGERIGMKSWEGHLIDRDDFKFIQDSINQLPTRFSSAFEFLADYVKSVETAEPPDILQIALEPPGNLEFIAFSWPIGSSLLDITAWGLRRLDTGLPELRFPGGPTTLRNLYFLKWYEDESGGVYHSPAGIRDRWNDQNSGNSKKCIAAKDNGVGVVNKGRKTAEDFLEKNQVSIDTAIFVLEKKMR